MKLRRIVMLALPLVLVAGGVAVGLSTGSSRNSKPPVAGKQGRVPIDAPTSWVPFQADAKTYIPGYKASVGRYARSADGSIWHSSGPSADDQRVVSIRNIPLATYYVFSEGRWERSPMDIDPANYRPKGRLTGSTGAELYPFRLAFLPGQNLSVYGREGIEVWRIVTGDGSVRLEAPSLNFFALVAQSITGRRLEYFNIVYEDPPAALFAPPPGVPVTAVNQIRGIGRKPPEGMLGVHDDPTMEK